jgi:nicotinamidase-related amidase
MKILIVVDMQKDFIDGALGTPEAAAITADVAKRITVGRNELVLFTRDTHGDDYLETPEGKKLPVIHCIKGTPGWEIDPAVKAAWQNHPDTIRISHPPENTFEKPVFGSVDLVKFLEDIQDEIESIEILGICTDICVISNAIMIKNTLPHIDISVNAALCAGVTPQSHNEALNVMKMCHITIL